MEEIKELTPKSKYYKLPKCFVAHSYDSPSQDILFAACSDVLHKFNLEPWYASYLSDTYQKLEDVQYDTAKSPLEKVVEMIANALFGIYDITTWKDGSTLHQARNVLIELGISIGLNKPAILLRYKDTENIGSLECFYGTSIVEFSGAVTLVEELNKIIPIWLERIPEQGWENRFCCFFEKKCEHRDLHPRAIQLKENTLPFSIFDGDEKDKRDFHAVVSDILSRYSGLKFEFVDSVSGKNNFNFALCATCQFSRSGAIRLHRLTPNTPPEAFIAIGISIAQQRNSDYAIPMIFIAKNMQDVPSLLSKYDIQIAEDDLSLKKRLRISIPTAVNQVDATTWNPSPLPLLYISTENAEPLVPTRSTEQLLAEQTPLVIVISGTDGAGKDSVIQLMKERGIPFHFVVTATTRPRRANEVNGRDYFFISKEEFARMIEEDELFEYAVVYGDYKGIPKQQMDVALASGKDVVLRVDVQGAETVRRFMPNAILIFLTLENEKELERRVRERKTETVEELALRIATSRKELIARDKFDYVITNRSGRLNETVDEISAIISSEHRKSNAKRVIP